jgi:hypothetical protein
VRHARGTRISAPRQSRKTLSAADEDVHLKRGNVKIYGLADRPFGPCSAISAIALRPSRPPRSPTWVHRSGPGPHRRDVVVEYFGGTAWMMTEPAGYGAGYAILTARYCPGRAAAYRLGAGTVCCPDCSQNYCRADWRARIIAVQLSATRIGVATTRSERQAASGVWYAAAPRLGSVGYCIFVRCTPST